MRIEGETEKQYVDRLKRTYRERNGIAHPQDENVGPPGEYWQLGADAMLSALMKPAILTVAPPGSGKSISAVEKRQKRVSTLRHPRPWEKNR